jgi:hypothetical protein
MKMEAGRWKREAKTSASDRVQVSGCKSQGLTHLPQLKNPDQVISDSYA